MEIKLYSTLPSEAVKIRKLVFVEEQGFKNEFDEIDAYASHLVMYKNNIAIATCRLYKKQNASCYVIGRIAVLKEYRGQKIGAELLKKAEEIVYQYKAWILGVNMTRLVPSLREPHIFLPAY